MRARIPSSLVPYLPLLGDGLRLLVHGQPAEVPTTGELQRVRIQLMDKDRATLEVIEHHRGPRQRNSIICEALALASKSALMPCPQDGPCGFIECAERVLDCA